MAHDEADELAYLTSAQQISLACSVLDLLHWPSQLLLGAQHYMLMGPSSRGSSTGSRRSSDRDNGSAGLSDVWYSLIGAVATCLPRANRLAAAMLRAVVLRAAAPATTGAASSTGDGSISRALAMASGTLNAILTTAIIAADAGTGAALAAEDSRLLWGAVVDCSPLNLAEGIVDAAYLKPPGEPAAAGAAASQTTAQKQQTTHFIEALSRLAVVLPALYVAETRYGGSHHPFRDWAWAWATAFDPDRDAAADGGGARGGAGRAGSPQPGAAAAMAATPHNSNSTPPGPAATATVTRAGRDGHRASVAPAHPPGPHPKELVEWFEVIKPTLTSPACMQGYGGGSRQTSRIVTDRSVFESLVMAYGRMALHGGSTASLTDQEEAVLRALRALGGRRQDSGESLGVAAADEQQQGQQHLGRRAPAPQVHAAAAPSASGPATASPSRERDVVLAAATAQPSAGGGTTGAGGSCSGDGAGRREGLPEFGCRVCAYPGCSNFGEASEADLRLQRCGACQRAMYCSRTCQAAHWKAGHKGECGRAPAVA